MLDLKLIREKKDLVLSKLNSRNASYDTEIEQVLKLDDERRQILVLLEDKKSKINSASKEIGLLKRQKEDEKAKALMDDLKPLSEEIKLEDFKLSEIDAKLKDFLLTLPNLPLDSVPIGKNESDNVVVKVVGDIPAFDFTPQDHVSLGENLGLLDFERASKIAGARFALLTGMGAKLERALINFMLDVQTENGYKEIIPPFLANEASLIGTGQLPKFEEDLFKCRDDEYYLIPTAEVPLTNIHRDEILPADILPLKYTAYTPCFRREAGSYGKDTRGLIRNHQFNKVEVVKLVKPEDGEKELEDLLLDAAKILDLLKLPYRIVSLCTGDIGFSSAKTYDLEVWMPSAGSYREISSCSLFTDFQARRLKLKYKDNKTNFIYTLNGSGLAVGRTFAAILENYQTEDGEIKIPEVLISYLAGGKYINK